MLLGPQRFNPTLGAAVRSLGLEGTIATVTAGWQEREAEDDELRDHLSGRTINLLLHARGEEVFERDPVLASAHKERQARLRQLQVLYRMRLTHAVDSARELMQREGEPELLGPAVSDAIETIRRLDAHHLERIRAVDAEFDATWRPLDRPAIARERSQIASILERAQAIALAGGHVAVLLNRLRLFGLLGMIGPRPLIAWSAGAMVLADSVVVFHDAPPNGRGNAEVLESGFGRFPGVVPLPHARQRLKLDDRVRVALHARRFAPAACVALDPGARIDWNGRSLVAAPETRRLLADGTVGAMEAA